MASLSFFKYVIIDNHYQPPFTNILPVDRVGTHMKMIIILNLNLLEYIRLERLSIAFLRFYKKFLTRLPYIIKFTEISENDNQLSSKANLNETGKDHIQSIP